MSAHGCPKNLKTFDDPGHLSADHRSTLGHLSYQSWLRRGNLPFCFPKWQISPGRSRVPPPKYHNNDWCIMYHDWCRPRPMWNASRPRLAWPTLLSWSFWELVHNKTSYPYSAISATIFWLRSDCHLSRHHCNGKKLEGWTQEQSISLSSPPFFVWKFIRASCLCKYLHVINLDQISD